jgi:hypothetical protein
MNHLTEVARHRWIVLIDSKTNSSQVADGGIHAVQVGNMPALIAVKVWNPGGNGPRNTTCDITVMLVKICGQTHKESDSLNGLSLSERENERLH